MRPRDNIGAMRILPPGTALVALGALLSLACFQPEATPTALPAAPTMTSSLRPTLLPTPTQTGIPATLAGSTASPTDTPFPAPTPTPTPLRSPTATPEPTPTPLATQTSMFTPIPKENAIEFVLEDRYAAGEKIEVWIRNNANVSYIYSQYYPACVNLKFYDESTQPRSHPSGIGEPLPPGFFIIPEGTHCDLIGDIEIKPGEQALLLTWNQEECIKDQWGCVESIPVMPGSYRIVGKFRSTMGSESTAEGSFTIKSPS